jgi:ATP-dependent DNA ligase
MTLPVAPPLKPMLAKTAEEIPVGDDWIYEPKWDGFRTLVFRDGKNIDLRSRNDRPMNRYFPEMEQLLLETLPNRVVLDGEIILPTPDGTSFDDLQQRLHPAASRVNKLAGETPTSFVAFDVLAVDKESLMDAPLGDRIKRLAELFGSSRPKVARDPATTPAPKFYLTPCTDDPELATEWFDDLEKVKLEGIIAKKLSLPYQPGDRVMLKIKHRRTCDCVIGGFRRHKNGGVGSLLLGLYDNGVLHYVGHTSSLSAAARKEFEAMLEPMRTKEGTFSFGGEEVGEWAGGPGGQSRWSAGKEEQEWVSITPTLVCEVSFDFIQSGVRFRHAARLLRMRDDKNPEECTFDQVRT